MKRSGIFGAAAMAALLAAGLPNAARAAEPAASPPMFDSGKLLATSGVSNVEGAGGGGIATWALITGSLLFFAWLSACWYEVTPS